MLAYPHPFVAQDLVRSPAARSIAAPNEHWSMVEGSLAFRFEVTA